MKAILKCVIPILIFFQAVGCADADCNPSCSAVGNETEPLCNTTTQNCLHGCIEGFAGERCQFKCSSNCSDCTVNECTENCKEACNIDVCYENHTCTQGCLDGLYGQNCSRACPQNCQNSTCHRENGTCNIGCVDGFYGDYCENMCSSLCNETHRIEAVTCDDKTLECKYTCNKGYGGDHCQYYCDYNCLKCGSEFIEVDKVECDLCRPDYYYFHNRCEECRKCPKDPDSTGSSCDEVDGTCYSGCIDKYCLPTCTSECSNFCINKVCEQFSCCCTEGCKYDVLGGCRCDEQCPTSCAGGKCFQDLSCKVCEVNNWGPKCELICNDHCQDAANTSTSACDRDGNCLFGCVIAFWGNTCSTNCPDNCLGKDCNARTGHCVQGCIKSYWGDVCDKYCSEKCLEAECYRYNATCRLGCVNGYYGMNCSVKCPENCINDTCSRENGACSLGCLFEYIGDRCSELTIPAAEPQTLSGLFIGITSGGFGVGLIALIIAALIIKNRLNKK